MRTPSREEACQKFIEEAMEAALYLRPDALGLTKAELISAATMMGFGEGTLNDALDFVVHHRGTVTRHRDRVTPVPSSLHAFANFLKGEFATERRNFEALDAIVSHLHDLADKRGKAKAFASRDELLQSSSINRHDMMVAFEILRLGIAIEDKNRNGQWRLSSSAELFPLPSVQTMQVTQAARSGIGPLERPDFESLFVSVKELLENIAKPNPELKHPVPETDRKLMSLPDASKVFIIHGRYEPARHEMGIFLRSMGLEPVLFTDVRKNMGGTAHIVKVVERGMELAQGVLALFTPEEWSALRPTLRKTGEPEEQALRWQGRPNVLFEAGLAYGRNPDRVAFVGFGDVKMFSDASGIHVFWPTNDYAPESYRTQLHGLLADGMHCAVNRQSYAWMTSGDFDKANKGLSGVSARDPFRVS